MSTLTQRHTGIVQRKKTKEGAEGGLNGDDVENKLDDIDEDDRDSKETRLTLMEEILLLGLKDREVYLKSCPSTQYYLSFQS